PPICGVRGERIHTVQLERDSMANWEVDLSENLEEYLQNYYRRTHWK
ncbi:hypothetical protein ISN45_Aa07g038650, partial [Arabidopsis thaliana x Arabidopsis arenosa]